MAVVSTVSETSTRQEAWARPFAPYILIALVALVILVPGTGSMPLIDRDEPRFSQATLEMMQRSDWVIPYFNHQYRFDKPILAYWLMRGGYFLFGRNEFGARFHSILSSLLTALVIFAWGRRRFSPSVAAAAALGFLTCLQLFVIGRSATADMPMILAVTVSQAALYQLLCADEEQSSRRWFFILYLSLGLGFLAKGPIAVLIPLLTALLLRWVLWRRPLPWRRLKLPWGAVFFLIIIGAWGLPALYRTHGLFWQVGMGEHVVRRGLEVFNGRFYSPFFYLVTAFFSLAPWIAFAGCGLRAVRSRWDRTNAFLTAWLVSPYLVFTFYATQLPHYVLPAFPAFFLLSAQLLDGPADETGWVKWWWRGVFALQVVLAGVLLPALIFALMRKAPAPVLLLLLGGFLLMTAAVALGLGFRLRRISVWIAGLLLMAAAAACAGGGLSRLVPAAQMQALFSRMPAQTRYLGYLFSEGSLVFYSQGRWEMTEDPKKLEPFFNAVGPCLAVVLTSEIKIDRYLKWELRRTVDPSLPLDADDFRADLDSVESPALHRQDFKGLNLGRFSWVTLRVYYRTE